MPTMKPADRTMAWRDAQKASLGVDVFNQNERLRKARQRRLLKEAKQELKEVVDARREEIKDDQENKEKPKEILKLSKVVDELNKYLNTQSKIDIPTVEVILREKVLPQLINAEHFKGCNKLFEAIYLAKVKFANDSEKKKTISRDSVKQQFDRIRGLYKKMFNKDMSCSPKSFTFLKKTDDVITFINNTDVWKTDTSRNAQFMAISSILKHLQEFEEEYSIYSRLSTSNTKTYLENRGDLELTDKERKNYMSWGDIKKTIHLKNKSIDMFDQSLFNIFMYLPPRRVMDYQFLTISNEGNAKNKDKRFNYLDTTGKNWELVYNKYKTADTYGQQTERVPPQLKKIFEKYVKESDLKDGDPLFGQKNNKFYKNFSNEIMRSFKKFTGKDISANILRHSYIADFLSSKKTLNQKKALAERMGHNISTQALYDRIVKELEK
jgi:hypothetical protein